MKGERPCDCDWLKIEDDNMIAETVLAHLRRADYSMDWAAQGREAELTRLEGNESR
jgi:two-component system response regulator QseB